MFYLGGKKKYSILAIALLLVAGSLVYGHFVFAQGLVDNTIGAAVATIVGWIAWIIIHILGLLLTLLMKILVNVAQYGDIIDVATVVEGWVVVRDICNMFFILALLVIAFATILRFENYNLKKLLPKLVLAAILINFSRTIFGLIIDFAQVIMLTFVSGFGQYGYNHLVDLFQVDNMLGVWEGVSGQNEVNSFAVAGGIIAGVLAMIVSIVVVTVVLAVLVFRIIMLWIYTIFSPLIFLGMAFPPMKGYVSGLWQDFIKQVTIGPILAFFIWLTLVTAKQSATNIGMTADTEGQEICAGANQFFCEDSFQTFIIVIGLLMGGLMVAQKAGTMTGKAAAKTETAAKRPFKAAGRRSWQGTKQGAKATGQEVGAQMQKTAAGRKLTALGSNMRSGGGATAGATGGAAAGTAVLPGIGTAIGAGLGAAGGALYGKKFTDKLKKRRQRNQQRARLAKDRGEEFEYKERKGTWDESTGAYIDNQGSELRDEKGYRLHRWEDYEENGVKYRRINEKGEMRRVNSAGEFVKQEGDQEKKVNKAAEADKAPVKAMGEKQATRWTAYESRKHKGWGAKDAAEDEKINKEAQEYMNQSNETLRKMFEMEQDQRKKMAQSLALAMKKGFEENNYKQVNEAKETLGDNPLLQKRFNDELNKGHMVLNNTKKDGTLDEAKIDKLVSSGNAEWKNQDAKNLNQEGLKLMARQTGNKFNDTLKSMIKTDKDKEKLKKCVDIFENYCVVTQSIRNGIDVNVDVEV